MPEINHIVKGSVRMVVKSSNSVERNSLVFGDIVEVLEEPDELGDAIVSVIESQNWIIGKRLILNLHSTRPIRLEDLEEMSEDVRDEVLITVDRNMLNRAILNMTFDSPYDDDIIEEFEEFITEKVYLAGPIATEGDVMFMSYIAQELRELGYIVHAPHEDDSINDKTNDPKAEDIFKNDGDAIDEADIVVLVESGREQIGTHMEAGKIIEKIKQGADLELIVFTSNYRVENTQIEDGKASASVNHYALGGYKEFGTWVDGMSDGLIEYMACRPSKSGKTSETKGLIRNKVYYDVSNTVPGEVVTNLVTGDEFDTLSRFSRDDVTFLKLLSRESGVVSDVPLNLIKGTHARNLNGLVKKESEEIEVDNHVQLIMTTELDCEEDLYKVYRVINVYDGHKYGVEVMDSDGVGEFFMKEQLKVVDKEL